MADDDKPADKDWQAEAEKWKALARKHEDQAKANHAELEKLKADQNSSRSDMDQVKEQLTKLTERAEQAERKALVAEVAQAKGLTTAQAKRLVGSTRAELETDADELLEAFGGGKPAGEGGKPNNNDSGGGDGSGSDGDGEGGDGSKKTVTDYRPKETLRPGASEDAPTKSGDDLAKEVLDRVSGGM